MLLSLVTIAIIAAKLLNSTTAACNHVIAY